MHRLDFCVIGRKPLERADTQERFAGPQRPEADIWRLQPGQVQGVCATRRRLGSRGVEMESEQINNARVAEVARGDTDNDASPGPMLLPTPDHFLFPGI